MYASAEIRFWWRGDAPSEVLAWFDAGPFPPGSGYATWLRETPG